MQGVVVAGLETHHTMYIGFHFGGNIPAHWAFGRMGVWAYGRLGVWAYGRLGVWAFGHMGVSFQKEMRLYLF
jgi:hypothetical protein